MHSKLTNAMIDFILKFGLKVFETFESLEQNKNVDEVNCDLLIFI